MVERRVDVARVRKVAEAVREVAATAGVGTAEVVKAGAVKAAVG